MSWSPEDVRNKLKKNSDGSYSPKSSTQTFTVRENRKPEGNRYELLVEPMGAVRMTKSDTWKLDINHPDPKKRQRVAVNKYFKYKRLLQAEAERVGLVLPEGNFRMIFYMSMPNSWSKKKKEEMAGNPHQQKSDIDNIIKGIFDSLLIEDKGVYDCRATKLWAYEGKITVLTNID